MESKAEDYRRKADDAEETAQSRRDYRARQAYLEMARLYRELAKQHDRISHWEQ